MSKLNFSGITKSPTRLLLVAAVVVLVFLAVGGAIVVLLDLPKGTPAAPAPTQTEIILDEPADGAQADMLIAQITAQPPQTPTPEVTATPKVVNPVCMRQAQQGEWLRRILQSFGTDYTKSIQYYTRVCSSQNNTLVCGPRTQISDPDYLYPEQWIEIPGITTEICQANGGTVISGQ